MVLGLSMSGGRWLQRQGQWVLRGKINRADGAEGGCAGDVGETHIDLLRNILFSHNSGHFH